MEVDRIRRARQADLAEYLKRQGEALKREGRRHKHKEHESLVITGNSYFWNSRQESGNAVDFLIRYRGMCFMQAVEALNGIQATEAIQLDFRPDFKPIESHRDARRVLAYLHKTRGIDYAILTALLDSGHLRQEAQTNNAVFVMYDQNGQEVGAEKQGTLTYKPFRGIQEGSKYGWGFNIRHGKNLNFALFFESAIDLLSFQVIKKAENKSLEGCLLVSMSGLKTTVIKTVLEAFTSVLEPVLCVDNDKAGQKFLRALNELKMPYRVRRPLEGFKDWNDQLRGGKYARPLVDTRRNVE